MLIFFPRVSKRIGFTQQEVSGALGPGQNVFVVLCVNDAVYFGFNWLLPVLLLGFRQRKDSWDYWHCHHLRCCLLGLLILRSVLAHFENSFQLRLRRGVMQCNCWERRDLRLDKCVRANKGGGGRQAGTGESRWNEIRGQKGACNYLTKARFPEGKNRTSELLAVSL